MRTSWIIEPRFNSQGSRFMLRGAFIFQFDTSRLTTKLCGSIVTEEPGLNRHYPELILDCSEMTQLDGHGVADIIRAWTTLKEVGTKLVLKGVNPSFRHKFELVGVGKFPVNLSITYTEEVKDAEQSVSAPAPESRDQPRSA